MLTRIAVIVLLAGIAAACVQGNVFTDPGRDGPVVRHPAPEAGANYRPDGSYLDYGDVPSITESARIKSDASDIPRVDVDGVLTYNPVTITQVGLQHDAWYRKSRKRRDARAAERMADWLVDHQDRRTGEWLYRFDFPVGGTTSTLASPWASAMAQGQAMSLLTRLWHRTGDRRYLAAAVRGLKPLHRSVARGGLTDRLRGHLFYEEYPTQSPNYTLNGFMFTLLGLHDLAAAGPSSDAGRLFDRGMRTLRKTLHLYDTDGLSAYHLSFRVEPGQPIHRSTFYHWVHVQLLTALDSVQPSRVLRRYRDAWARYEARPGDPS